MGATLTLDIELDGWYAKNRRVLDAIAAIPVVEIGPNDTENRQKAIASFNRNDVTYPLSAEAKRTWGSLIARTLKAIAVGDSASKVRDVMDVVGRKCVTDLRKQIRAGAVEGPQRSAGWVATKGQDINMLGLTGRFVRSLVSRLLT